MTVITRFAPSPTGFLHIGGARTALFNWLFSRHHGGKFLLRVEDTDKERSTEEAKEAILAGMQWLGLKWDNEVYYQSQFAGRHAEVANQLLVKGKAYKCSATPEELTQLREAVKAGTIATNQEMCQRLREMSEAATHEDGAYTVRIKAPYDSNEETLLITDHVQGDVSFPIKDLDDFVILRADGSPTYMLAVVVDDHDMGVTHIIRGDDHLNNAARQTIIYHAMGWNTPAFGHIPLIHGQDGAKLSKRHGALGVEAYRDMGYLPQALCNYLLKLGWAHGDDEIISTEQAIEWFGFDGMNKAAARFDFDKLANLNGHYIRACDNETLVQLTLPLLNDRLEKELSEEEKTIFSSAVESLKQRVKLLPDLIDSALFLFHAPKEPADDKAAKQLNDGLALLKDFLPQLESQERWQHDALMDLAKSFAESHDTKLGKVMSPIRVAITGSTASPSMFEVMELLGKDESLARLKTAC